MRLSDIIKTANHNLLRNKPRTFLTILAIFIGSFTIILNSAINAGVDSFIDKQVTSIGGDGYFEVAPAAMYDQISAMMNGESSVTEYNPDQGSAITASISEDDLAAMRAIDGVESLNPYHNVSPEYITSDHTDKRYNLNAALSPDNSLVIDMSAGRQADADSEEYQVTLTERYLEPLGFESAEAAVGQRVTLAVKQTAKCYIVETPEDCLATLEATVAGVQAPGIFSMNDARLNPALNDALYDLSMAGVSESVKNQTYFAVGHADPAKIDQVKSQLLDLGFAAITVDDEVGMIRTFFDVILIVFNIFGGIALLAAAIGIINTLYMSVEERTREIGLDKALGLTSGKIFLSFSIEAILLGFWGSVVGVAVSMLVGYAANAAFHAEGGFLESFPTFQLVEFSPATVLPIVLIIMLIAFVAGTFPARKAAKKDPIEALRYE